MSNDVITVGSKTTTGGSVISGHGGVIINGQKVALVGDIATCPCGNKICRGQGPIVAQSPRAANVFGTNLARVGDLVDTGCGSCFLDVSSHQVSLNTSIATNLNMGSGVNIGNGVNINGGNVNIGSGVTFGTHSNANVGTNNSVAPSQSSSLKDETTAVQELIENDWQPVNAKFPLLVFATDKKMGDTSAADMKYGKEHREKIGSYGFMRPFKQTKYYSYREGYSLDSEDQFNLPPEVHFKRMRSLANGVFLGLGFSIQGETKDVFFKMVEKFQRNEGGYFSDPHLTKALKEHVSTAKFHHVLINCLSENIIHGVLPVNIESVSSAYMAGSKGAHLPMFGGEFEDLRNGTVLTVHDIWSMHVYAESLEFKGNQIRGVFRYEVEDHFGLDANDINHKISEPNHWYEEIEGFRSWYLLQHFEEYGYQPFITKMDFKL